jgi:hypothetical protein
MGDLEKYFRTFEFINKKFFEFVKIFTKDKYGIIIEYDDFVNYYNNNSLTLSETPKNVLDTPIYPLATFEKNKEKKQMINFGTGKCKFIVTKRTGAQECCGKKTFSDINGCPYCRIHFISGKTRKNVEEGNVKKYESDQNLTIDEYEKIIESHK